MLKKLGNTYKNFRRSSTLMSLRKVASFGRLDFLAILAGAPNDLFYKTLFGEANIALDFLVLEHD